MTTDAKTAEALARLEEAITAIESTENWQAWLALSGRFRSYSARNTLLIWLANPNATYVAGFRTWQTEFNRSVKKGEKGIQILAPRFFKPKDDEEDADDDDAPRVYFRSAYVFDVSQTEGDPLPEPPQPEQITGDSLAHHLPKLSEFCSSIGFTLSCDEPQEGALGTCNYATREIRLLSSLSPNQRVCVFIHELVHALGAASKVFGKRGAETIAESAAYLVACGLGINPSATSAPYLAAFSTPDLRRQAVGGIEHYASTIEVALGLRESASAPPSVAEGTSSETAALIAA